MTALSAQRAAGIAVLVSLLVLAAKLVAWVLTDSEVILSDAFESVVNVVASTLALASVWYSARPPDREHPYGHGRIEFVSAGVEGGMLLVAGVLVIVHATTTLAHGPVKMENLGIGLLLTILGGAVNGVTALYLLWVAKRTGSAAIEADGKHLLGDLITTLAVIAALGIINVTGWLWVDAASAICVGLGLALLGGSVIRKSLGGLLDRQDSADTRALEVVLESHLGDGGISPIICSYEKVRHRHDGNRHWIDLHVRLPGKMSVQESHAIASQLEHEVVVAIGGTGKATAHIEPCVDQQCWRCRATLTKQTS